MNNANAFPDRPTILTIFARALTDTAKVGWHGHLTVTVKIQDGVPQRDVTISTAQTIRLPEKPA